MTIGKQFILTSKRPWGVNQQETETFRCVVTAVLANRLEYLVTEVVSVENRCPAYRPATAGGMTFAGWNHYAKNGSLVPLS